MKKTILALSLALLSTLSYSQSKIYKAVRNGDVQFVSDYIKSGQDLNVQYKATTVDEYNNEKISHTFDLLEYAANQGNEEIIKLLLGSKDLFSDFENSLNKAFAASISHGKIEIIKLFLDNGADIDSRCEVCYGQAAIQTALEYGYFDIFTYLFQNGAKLDVQNNYGRTLLHSIAHTGNTEIAKLLIEKGLGVNTQDVDGATPLIYAASNGEFEMFKLLLDKGAEPIMKENDGSDVLMSAVENGNPDIVNFLLEKYCDVNYKNNDNETPLIIASQAKKSNIVQLLITKGAEVNPANSKGETALLWAIWNDDVETAKLLIEKGADLTAMDYLKPAKKYVKDKSFVEYLKTKTNTKKE